MIKWRLLLGSLGGRRAPSLGQRYLNALSWVRRNTLPGAGIRVTADVEQAYPEVSGYFIPTLLACGERERAVQYGRWLAAIQNPDGSWSDPDGRSPYTFDTGQILKGLLALVERHPEFEPAILKGGDWLSGMVRADGRVVTPDTSQWLLPGGRRVPEAIHLYALEPLRQIGELWCRPRYLEQVEHALDYYLADRELTSFNTLAHFHAYIIDALVDLGYPERARQAMGELAGSQSKDGFLPAYRGVGWSCSTALFQYALIWYKLGAREAADRTFSYACSLQLPGGGFYGGYGRRADYFERREISWAVKYFLDAFWAKVRGSFDDAVDLFPETVEAQDGRYRLLARTVREAAAHTVLEAGSGKGRFSRRLRDELPHLKLSGLDLSHRMLAALPAGVVPLHGSLLDMPVADGSFDLVFCIEALEHAVDLPLALRELARAVAPAGLLVIIDKNRERLGRLAIAEWEQWFQAEEVARMIGDLGFQVRVEHCIPYEGNDGSDGLFMGWIARRI